MTKTAIMTRQFFQLDMHPQDATKVCLEKVVAWLKANKPELDAALEGNNKIVFDSLDDENGDVTRMWQAYMGHLALKFAKELNLTPEIK